MLPLLPMKPRYLAKIWGGSRLAGLEGKRAWPPTDERTGEAWEVADLPEGTSEIATGRLAGRTLHEIGRADGEALRGRAHVDGRFPLLVKLIDAADDLSVQVHPGPEHARRHPGTFSKDEAWLVVDADAGAAILHGAKPGVTADDFRRAIAEGRADQLLRRVEMSRGDVVHVPPETLHAILRGLLILEVQEPSDTTYRVYDYGRLENGRPRALHVEKALEVADLGPAPPARGTPVMIARTPGAVHEELVRSRSFAMQRVTLEAGAKTIITLPVDAPGVLFALEGTLEAVSGDSAVQLARGATAVVPCCRRAVELHADAGVATAILMTPG